MWITIGIYCRSFDFHWVLCSNSRCNCMLLMNYLLWCQFSIVNLMGKICIRNPLNTNQCCKHNALGMWNQSVLRKMVDICCKSIDFHLIHCSNFHCNGMLWTKYRLWHWVSILKWGHDLHSKPSKYKPSSHTQCDGDVEPVGAAENGWHLLQVSWSLLNSL